MKEKKFPGTKQPKPEIEFPSVTEVKVPDPPVPNRAHTEMRLDPTAAESALYGVIPPEIDTDELM